MISEKRFADLVGQIYDGCFDDSAWQNTVEHLCKCLGDSAGGIDHNATADGIDAISVSADLDQSIRDQAVREFNTPETNPGFAAVLRASVDRPFTLGSFVDADTFERHEGVRFFFRPHNFTDGLFVAAQKDVSTVSFFSLFREASQPKFSEHDVRLLARFSPHIRRALQVRISRLRNERMSCIRQSVAHLSCRSGIIILDHRLRVVEADETAQALFHRTEGLCIRGGRLASTDRVSHRDTESLEAYIKTAAFDVRPFIIGCASGRFISVRLIHVASDMIPGSGSGIYAITVGIIDSAATPDVQTFVVIFELTAAEKRFLEFLVNASNATEAARQAGITRNTAKTHLSHIFQKTGCESQVQLMLRLGQFH